MSEHRRTCLWCNGRGRKMVVHDDWIMGVYEEYEAGCAPCEGTGYTVTKTGKDSIKCVCGKQVSSILDLAEHRKSHS